jgi:hypothetical protein
MIEARNDAKDHILNLQAADLRHLGAARHVLEKHDIGRTWRSLRAADRFEESIRFANGSALRSTDDSEVTLNLEFAGGHDRRIFYHAHYALFLLDTSGNPIGCYRDSSFDVSRNLTISSRRICGLSDTPDIGGIDLHIHFDELSDCENDHPVAIRLGMVAFGPVAGIVAAALPPALPAASRLRGRRATLGPRRRRTIAPSDIILSAR